MTPKIMELTEIDGKLAVFLDIPPTADIPGSVRIYTDDEYRQLCAEVRRAEREACAKAVENIHHYGEYGEDGAYIIGVAAEAIRARGKP